MRKHVAETKRFQKIENEYKNKIEKINIKIYGLNSLKTQ
jgi:hypothetical protein